jgi:putative membrane protein (TIGR04086 family)
MKNNERGVQMEPVKKTVDVRFTSPLFSGLVYAFIIMAAASLIFSFVLAFTSQSEASFSFYVYLIHLLSIFIGAYVCGKRTDTRGWYYGGILGLLYSLIIVVVGFLAFDHGLTLQTLFALVAAFFIGAFGGIIGVNHSK